MGRRVDLCGFSHFKLNEYVCASVMYHPDSSSYPDVSTHYPSDSATFSPST